MLDSHVGLLVRVHRRVVGLILFYVALDLSLAWMPGAFVFEAGKSVESIQMSRVRQVAEIETALAGEATHAVIETGSVGVRLVAQPVSRRPRRHGGRHSVQTPAPPPPSEDPH